MKQEDEAWIEVGNSYNSFRGAVLAELEERKKEFTSAKAKGKRRATAEDIALWDVSEKDLPEYFRGKGGLSMARSIVEVDPGRKSPLKERIEDLEFTVRMVVVFPAFPVLTVPMLFQSDRLYTLTQSALATTRLGEADLDRRFASLSRSIASRSQPIQPSLNSTSSGILSSYLPSTLSRPPPTTDPQDLLRAMSRVDAERPQAQVGDAARRAAREVQRAHEAPGGMAERRLTGVPPPTPRKPPGTPRRATTPGKGR